jgi:hypothetical protein
MEFATIKLQEIIQQSPNVVNINSANAIEGNFILKFCNHYQMDDIDKIKYIKDAVEKDDDFGEASAEELAELKNLENLEKSDKKNQEDDL